MSGNRVKLYTYQHEPNETIIDTYQAESWEDFLIIHLKAKVTQQEIAALQVNIKEAEVWRNKHVIIMPEGMDIEFYGITDSKPVDEQIHRVGETGTDTPDDSLLHVPDQGASDGAV